MQKCAHCGADNDDGFMVCHKCWRPLGENATPATGGEKKVVNKKPAAGSPAAAAAEAQLGPRFSTRRAMAWAGFALLAIAAIYITLKPKKLPGPVDGILELGAAGNRRTQQSRQWRSEVNRDDRIQTASRLLKLIFNDIMKRPEPTYIALWCFPSKKTYWLNDIRAAAVRAIELSDKGQNVYFGLGVQGRPQTGNSRGLAKDVIGIGCVWADIDYEDDGRPRIVTPASGTVRAYAVTLDRVRIGNIEQRNVQAVVMSGNHPPLVLLGQTFLSRVKIQDRGNLMVLQAKY